MMHFEVKRIELIAQQVCMQLALDGCSLARGMEIEAYVGHASNDVIVRFSRRLYGKKLEDFAVSYPADWFEAFKERWFPARLKKHYPVQYTTKTVNFHAVFPDWVGPVSRQVGSVSLMISCPETGNVGLFDSGEFTTTSEYKL